MSAQLHEGLKPIRVSPLTETWQGSFRNIVSPNPHPFPADTSDEGTLVHVDAALPLRSLLATLGKRASRAKGSIPTERSEAGKARGLSRLASRGGARKEPSTGGPGIRT